MVKVVVLELLDNGSIRCAARLKKIRCFGQQGQEGVVNSSVAAALADVFRIWRTRAAMNLKIGMQVDEIRSRGVLCQL